MVPPNNGQFHLPTRKPGHGSFFFYDYILKFDQIHSPFAGRQLRPFTDLGLSNLDILRCYFQSIRGKYYHLRDLHRQIVRLIRN